MKIIKHYQYIFVVTYLKQTTFKFGEETKNLHRGIKKKTLRIHFFFQDYLRLYIFNIINVACVKLKIK
jgi:hypothetical protein